MSLHTCHARGCRTPVKPEMLMCVRHWRMVPKDVQRKVRKHYRHGQCDDMNPSLEWHAAANEAIRAVFNREAETK